MLGHDIAAALPELRFVAESLMTDTCTITREGVGNGPFNNGTGQYDKPARVVVYSGKCRLQIASVMGDASEATAGDREVTTQGAVLQLPVSTSGAVAVNDVAEITTAANDDALVGRMFTVEGRHAKSQATARRLRVTEVTG